MYSFDTTLFWERANDFLLQMTPPNVDLQRYFVSEKQTDIKEIVIMMFSTIQDYRSMPNSIKFWACHEIYRKILCEFDFTAILDKYNADSLLETIKGNIDIKNSEFSFTRYAKGIISICDFLKRYNLHSGEDFNAFCDDYLKANSRMELAELFNENIYGMGFATSCNFLKDIGFTGFLKPDTHINNVVIELGLIENISNRAKLDKASFVEGIKLADTIGVTPFHFDKVLWLIYSGNFHKDNIKVKPQKDAFIQHIKKTLILEERQ